ncbi:hypothetical protein M407DRAFT_196777 [Tulasnella calospora MUT 4182]|uniref:Uncharacterized protein n=1 Tax=Tulasnella calospora MUT 4182 TaxID=1051891 RepID=A0A0C3LZQ4_9AGAM|nr:hypothetical protein M407DRAFT_196777 [Tulasnella calospora MUT 4182]
MSGSMQEMSRLPPLSILCRQLSSYRAVREEHPAKTGQRGNSATPPCQSLGITVPARSAAPWTCPSQQN